MSNRKRNNQFLLYLTDEERYIFEEKYKLSGMKDRNTFIRSLIKYGFVYDVDYSELKEYNYQLSKIGTNINQIAHMANATGTISKKDIENVEEMMKKVWRLQESMLSKQPSIRP